MGRLRRNGGWVMAYGGCWIVDADADGGYSEVIGGLRAAAPTAGSDVFFSPPAEVDRPTPAEQSDKAMNTDERR